MSQRAGFDGSATELVETHRNSAVVKQLPLAAPSVDHPRRLGSAKI